MTGDVMKKNDSRAAIMLGDHKRAIYYTVLPFFISSIIGQINMLADVAWCSGLGSDHISAIQIVMPLYWVIFDIGLGIGLGCNVIISRRIGENNLSGAQKTISQGIVLSIMLAILFAPFLYYLIGPMMDWMDASSITELSRSYLTPILICNIFQVLSPTLSGTLRGEGASNMSNYALITGTIVNIILDPIFIYGLDKGVMGAGMATAASSIVSVLIMIYLYLSHKTYLGISFRGFAFDLNEIKNILFIGIPKMIELFFMDILDAFNRTFLIMCGGVNAITLFSVPYRLVMFGVMVPNSFAMALTPVSAANLGAGKSDMSKKAFKLCLRNAAVIIAALLTVYLVFAEYLIVPFINSDSMVPLELDLVEILRIEAFVIPALGFTLVCNSMLQSMKKPLIPLIFTILRTGLTTLSFALLAATSVQYMCIGMVVSSLFIAAITLLVTKKKVSHLNMYQTVTE